MLMLPMFQRLIFEKDIHFWKVGKLNHMKEVEDKVDWHKFYVDVVALLDSLQAKYYIKEDLKKYSQAADCRKKTNE